MDWSEVPHLSEEEKKKILSSTQPYLREARSKGIPSLGSGAIYPIPESDIQIDPLPIPDYWPKVYAMDVGWRRTAALWGAIDRENQIVYIYNEYYRSQAEPIIHATSIKARGEWIPGVIDPASSASNIKDGKSLMMEYEELGLELYPADNTVEAGIHKVWEWLSEGRIKIFSTCKNFFLEYRLYRRDEKGRIVKENDHLMDDLRYLMMTGLDYAITKPKSHEQIIQISDSHRNAVTGY